MAYRDKYLSIRLPEADWENVRDIGNVWGESLSEAGWRLIQRGVEAVEKEMGSKTPTRVKVHRLKQRVKERANLEKDILDTYQTINEGQPVNKEHLLAELKALADETGVVIT